MGVALRVSLHILLFLVAIVVFYLGLGIGLALNPLIGTLLWFAAGAIGVLNLVWMMRYFSRRGEGSNRQRT